MWQVQFLYVVELERQRELERRRRLADSVRSPRPSPGRRPFARRALALLTRAGDAVIDVLDRPLIGSNHA